MQITLDQHEIETAIAAYARKLIHIDEAQHVGVEIHVGRGANSHTASLSIGIASEAPAQDVVATPVEPTPVKKSNVSKLSLKSAKTFEAAEEEAGEPVHTDPDEAEAKRSDEVNNADDARFQDDPLPDASVAAKSKSLFSKG